MTPIRSRSRSAVVTPRESTNGSAPTAADLAAQVDARLAAGETISTSEFRETIRKASAAARATKAAAKAKESSKAKARRSAAERGVTANVPETDPAPAKVAKVAKKSVKSAKKAEPKAPRPKLTSYSVRKDGTLSARGLTCLCGCRSMTVTNDARFVSGHDAKMRQAILTSEDRLAAIPEIVLPFFQNKETIAGLRLAGSKVLDVKAGVGGEE